MAADPIIRTCSLIAALLLAAPAIAQDGSAYVRARAADAAGLAGPAAAGYAAALDARPKDELLAMRAYRQALAAGDYNLASRAAAVMVRGGSAPPDTAVLGFAIALNAGDIAGAKGALDRIATGPLNFTAPVLEAWLAVDRGEDPMPALEQARSNPLAGRYAAYHRPLLMIAAGRSGEAIVALSALIGGEGDENLRLDAATLLAARGERRLAEPLIAGRADYESLRRRIGKGVTPNAAFGASRLLLGMAQDIAEQKIAVLSILLTRSALLLDPQDDRARLYLAEALSESGADALALDELAKVPASSSSHHGAQAGTVATLQRAGRAREAIPLARMLAEKGNAADSRAYGDALAADSQFANAAIAYRTALGRAGEGDWELHYLEGSALDRAGRWTEALPALRRAIALGPDQAAALEYLGGAQVLRGENLPEAQALLERASSLRPDDAGIAASLGRAYFARGDVAAALPLLEKAVQGDPGGARSNEYLGDAYWRLGRHYEARYAWGAAAIYADADTVRRIQGKIAQGL